MTPEHVPRHRPSRRDAVKTRTRLLAAAGQAFAEHGFEGANLRDICRTAKVNLGAVKYYFGNKEKLYLEALVLPHQEMVHREPVPTLEEFDGPEQALKAWLDYLLRVIFVRRPIRPYLARLLMRELMQPTIALDQMVQLVISKVRGELLRIIAALVGGEPQDRQVGELANMTISLCIQREMGRALLERLGFPPPKTEAEIGALSELVNRFALAGIKGFVRG